MGLALLVWVGGGLLKQVLYFFGNERSLGRTSPILYLSPLTLTLQFHLVNKTQKLHNCQHAHALETDCQ